MYTIRFQAVINHTANTAKLSHSTVKPKLGADLFALPIMRHFGTLQTTIKGIIAMFSQLTATPHSHDHTTVRLVSWAINQPTNHPKRKVQP